MPGKLMRLLQAFARSACRPPEQKHRGRFSAPRCRGYEILGVYLQDEQSFTTVPPMLIQSDSLVSFLQKPSMQQQVLADDSVSMVVLRPVSSISPPVAAATGRYRLICWDSSVVRKQARSSLVRSNCGLDVAAIVTHAYSDTLNSVRAKST